jgi:hypothetical protein
MNSERSSGNFSHTPFLPCNEKLLSSAADTGQFLRGNLALEKKNTFGRGDAPPTSSRRATPPGTPRTRPCRTAGGRRRRPFRRTRPPWHPGRSSPPSPASTRGHFRSTRSRVTPTSPPWACYRRRNRTPRPSSPAHLNSTVRVTNNNASQDDEQIVKKKKVL